MRCEVIVSNDELRHGKAMLVAMIRNAPDWVTLKVSSIYEGNCEWLMMYGHGHLVRGLWFRRQIKSGAHSIAFDLPYWNKRDYDRPMRVTIDADHPQKLMGRQREPSDRFAREGIILREDYNAQGPIVLVGMGPKSRAVNAERGSWEVKALSRIRLAYPGREIVFRPKKDDVFEFQGIRSMRGMSIEQVLKGASLVVTRHSNVAVDACIAGIPVVCDDGAAAALYGFDLSNPVQPTKEQRLRFLYNLAWWQWAPSEASQCWQFLQAQLN